NEVEDEWLATEVIAQLHTLAGLVAKGEIGRHLRVQMLLDADILQPRRAHVRRRRGDAAVNLRGRGDRQCERQNALGGGRIEFLKAHCFSSLAAATVLRVALSLSTLCGRTGKPRCTSKSIARSMGIRTIPDFSSTHP